MQRLIVNVIAIFSISFSSVTHPIVPVPAADQSEPIAITGAVIHIGNGMIVNDGIITFDRGLITAVGVAGGGINLVNHALIDVEGRHVYPGFVLPNSTLGLIEVNSVRATSDVLEEGDINASVRSAIAYNTDSEIIPANRFNGILTAQVAPQGGLISGSSTVFKLDGWNWEDAMLAEDVGLHLHWPSYVQRRRNSETGLFETVDNENYEGQTQLLHSLFQDAQAYSGQLLNLNLLAMQPLFNGVTKLFIHADEAKQIISAIRFARSYGIQDIVLVGGADALSVKDFLLAQNVPVIYERIHELPQREWQDVDMPFKTPFLLHDAGIKVGIGGGATSIDRQRNLPFFAGTAAAYGLNRETALAMITSVNAEILGVADRVGTLEVGKDATLFISEGDALDMRTSQVLGAYIQGRDIDLYGTQQQLYERFRVKYANQLER
ncbi:MAG: amidohydrolase family protein [Pseudomonadales bacterium]|nr:amidohydrolase family protein [Pseudomonadales bacterium]HAC87319.1 amidohydrolase [Gammaproteobacteria bacterium]HAD71965.1 amidohydrolase [Gammaproteobacteria bacterium]|tara:strand:+ start:1903 stop:3210 length:1308 start_codon:yes stop_codon:yes gene_type:complete